MMVDQILRAPSHHNCMVSNIGNIVTQPLRACEEFTRVLVPVSV